jgi:hypothetical protein
MYIEQLTEMVHSSNQNTVEGGKQITLLIPYYRSSRLATLLKIIEFQVKEF